MSLAHVCRRPAASAAALGLSALTLSLSTANAHATSAASPAGTNAYRHGAFPMKGAAHAVPTAHAAHAAANQNMFYHGGTNGVGVTTGAPRVYLIFWGAQWGARGTDANGYTTLTGDPDGMAPRLQALFKGLGTGGELWSGVMTQYCQGIAFGSTDCSASTQHVGYPTGGALAGVWVDASGPAPYSATPNQIGAEAVKASGHFGNTTAAANRNNQYVVISPTGTHPDKFDQGSSACAWHDYTGDPSMTGGPVNSPYGDMAFTNLPYIPDAGLTCGAGWVNKPGTLDGVTIIEGHEFAETVTDQFPVPVSADPDAEIISGGWATGAGGQENGDLCAWKMPGEQGALANVKFSTGSFPMQSTWSNDANNGAGGCVMSHPIVGNGGAGTLNGTHTLTISGNALDDPALSKDNKQLITYQANHGANQSWTFTQQPDGSYEIKNAYSLMCVDDKLRSTTAGNPVIQYGCSGAANQHWKATKLSDGTYTLVNAYSGRLLTTASGTSNAPVIQQTDTGSALQHWTIN